MTKPAYLEEWPPFKKRGSPATDWESLLDGLPVGKGLSIDLDLASSTIRSQLSRFGKSSGRFYRLYVNPETEQRSIWRER